MVLALATAVGFLGGIHWTLDLFAHFRVQLGFGLLVCLAAAWRLRQPRISAVAAVATLANFVVVSPQLVYQRTAEAQGAGTIRLVHANVNYFNPEVETTLDFFRETDPDILLIVEANERWMTALESLKDQLPHTIFEKKGSFGIALMSRYPMIADGVFFIPRNPSIVARVDTPGGTLRVVGAHPWSPATARRARLRDEHLAAMATYVRNETEPTVVLGDLNTTPWGHAFRAFVAESGLRDTSRGVGYQWSWPAEFWPLALPIDHALVSDGVRVLDRRMGPPIGSDHRPLVVDIALRPGS